MKLHLIVPVKERDKILNRPLLAPLGLMCLDAYTPEGVETRLIDENLERIDFDDRPDLVGITAMTATVRRAYEIADSYRKRGVPVVMGGIHASMLPEEALEHVDAVVVGEAERMWPRVVADAEAGRLDPIYKMDDFSDYTATLPAKRGIINRKYYWMSNGIQTSRGCPHGCNFCSVTSFNGRRVRERDIDDVLAEIDSLPVNKYLRRKAVPFVDDNIAANPRRAKEFFKALIPLEIIWGSQACISFGDDEELVALAAESGCRMLFIGLETVSERTLAEIGKHQNKVERYAHSLRTLRKHGIHVTGSFVFGFDSDDESTFKDTLEFAIRNKIQLAQFSNLTPLPGTRLYNKLINENRMKPGYWLKESRNNRAVFQPVNFSKEGLCDMTRVTQTKFYSLGSIARRFYPGRYSPHMLLYNLLYNRFGVDRRPIVAPATTA